MASKHHVKAQAKAKSHKKAEEQRNGIYTLREEEENDHNTRQETKEESRTWLVWLSGLSTSLWTKGSLVRFPVRAHAWVAVQVPSRGSVRGNHTRMFLSLSFSLPSLLSKQIINKYIFLKESLINDLLYRFSAKPAVLYFLSLDVQELACSVSSKLSFYT